MKKDDSKSMNESGKIQNKKLKNISLICLESEFSSIENINHFIILFNYDISNIFQSYYVMIVFFLIRSSFF